MTRGQVLVLSALVILSVFILTSVWMFFFGGSVDQFLIESNFNLSTLRWAKVVLVTGITGLALIIPTLIAYNIAIKRSQFEANLRESKEEYRQAADLVKVGHWLWDEIEDQAISCSEELARIHGVSVEEYVASTTSIRKDIEWAHPEDRARYEIAIGAAVSPGQAFDIEYRIVARDGQIRYVREIGEPEFDENGVLVRSRGTVQDITQQKLTDDALRKSEERYRSLFDHIPISIWVEDWSAIKPTIDKLREQGIEDFNTYFRAERALTERLADDTLILDFNEPTLAIYGASSKEEFWPFANHDFQTDDEYLAYCDALAAFARGETKCVVFGWEKTFDGNQIYVRDTVYIPDEYYDTWARVVHTTEDITERKKAESLAKIALDEAQYANRAKSDFLAHMSHELRTPLNSIIGFSQTIGREVFGKIGNDKYVEYAHDILGSGHHLLHLVNDVLDISKIEAGELTLDEAVVDLHQVLEVCLRMIRGRENSNGIPIQYVPPDNLPNIRVDEYYVKQILLNLLSNAVKFNVKGGVVYLKIDTDQHHAVSVTVSDTGVGIAPADISKVLEPFGQARPDSLKAHHGTGLGLSISKRLAELHGGTLELESELGKGTTVTVRFPTDRTIRI